MEQKLTVEFLTRFHANMTKQYPRFSNLQSYGYTSTYAWCAAFKQTCTDLACEDFYTEYEALEWDASDDFDRLICDLLVKHNISI